MTDKQAPPPYTARSIQYGPPISLDGRGRDTYLMACKVCGAFIPTGLFGDSPLAELHATWHNKMEDAK